MWNPARVVLVVAASLFLVACGATVGTVDDPASSTGTVPGQYIVTLVTSEVAPLSSAEFEGLASRVSADHRATPGRPLRLINAFVATDLDDEDVVELARDPRVAAVEPDRIMSVDNTQTGPHWNLDRLDQRSLPLDRSFSYGVTGDGVTVYVLDTGIRSTHDEFGGRVLPGFTLFDDGVGYEDCHGHGTHVAGTVGGITYGVAKGVRLVPVRVLSCTGSGTASGVIAGLDWVASNRTGPAVANLSLGGEPSNALDAAVRNLVAHGVPVIVSAGNANTDACAFSPARVAEALTTGATTSQDLRSSFSNFGPCVDVFAPGSGVRSATYAGDSSAGNRSGTSMAAPHVAGVAALMLEASPGATAPHISASVLEMATVGAVAGAGDGSPNLLLYADPWWSPAAPPAPAPDPGPDPSPTPDPDPDPDPSPAPEPQPEPQPEPEPGSPPGPPCANCALYVGSLTGNGDGHTWPNAAGYVTTTRTGLHQGWLIGPADADFDLVLEVWQGNRWRVAATSAESGSNEEIHFVGKAATYRWGVTSTRGSGSYELYLSLP